MYTRNRKNYKVSVIFATYNEKNNIPRCVESIRNQTYRNIEMIAVDNGSSDGTGDILNQLSVRVLNLKDHVDIKNIANYRGAQVNLGARMTSGEIFFFPDADMTFDRELIAEAVELLYEYDALYVPEVVVGKGLFGKLRNFERSFYNGTVIDAPRFVTRGFFQKVGGFDEYSISFAPDDWDLAKKLKKIDASFSITNASKYHHEKQLKIKKYIQKKMGYMHTFDSYITKWGKNDSDIRKQFGVGYRYFGVFLENGKWKRVIRSPLMSLGVFALRFAIGIAYLEKKFYKNHEQRAGNDDC